MSIKKIKIKIHPSSSQEKIEEREGFLEVWTKEKPIEGRANDNLVKLLKKYFKQDVKIVSGFSSKIKFVEIIE
jgi:uncharacterized protein (TIGR00251 family)